MCDAQIPAELWDITLDHLWDDPHSLAACGLVCRAWCPTTRFHLFGTIHLRHGRGDLSTFDKLLQEKCSTLPAIAFYVRKLHMDMDNIQRRAVSPRFPVRTNDSSPSHDLAGELEAFNYHVTRIADELTNVRALTLRNMTIGDVILDVDTEKSLLRMARNVERITLQIFVGDVDSLLRLLTVSSKLSAISIVGVREMIPIFKEGENQTLNEDRSATSQEPATIEHLDIELLECSPEFRSALTQKLSGPSYRHRWRSLCLRASDFDLISDVFPLNAASLVALHLDYCSCISFEPSAFPNLSQLIALKYIYIRNFLSSFRPSIHDASAFQQLAHMLSTIPSGAPRTIVFTHTPQGQSNQRWAPLDAALAACTARVPLRIEFYFFGGTQRIALVADTFRMRLPLTLARGGCIEMNIGWDWDAANGQTIFRL